MSSGAAVPPTPSGRLPRRPPSTIRHPYSSVPSPLAASPRCATMSLNDPDLTSPSGLPADGACAVQASGHSVTCRGATPQPGDEPLARVTHPQRAHFSSVVSRLPRASDSGSVPGLSGPRVPQAPACSGPPPSPHATSSPLWAHLFYGVVDRCTGHDPPAPRFNDRRAPSPAPYADRMWTGRPPPGCESSPCAVASRPQPRPRAALQGHTVRR